MKMRTEALSACICQSHLTWLSSLTLTSVDEFEAIELQMYGWNSLPEDIVTAPFGSSVLLRFLGKHPAMDICPLLPECHGSEVIFDRSRRF